MPQPISDVLVFESDLFSNDNTVLPDGKVADVPLGIPVGDALFGGLTRLRKNWKVDEPIWEDWGTVLFVRTELGMVRLSICWVPLKADDSAWSVQFSESRGCLAGIFGAKSRREVIDPVKQAVAEFVAADSENFSNVRWLTEAEFREIY